MTRAASMTRLRSSGSNPPRERRRRRAVGRDRRAL